MTEQRDEQEAKRFLTKAIRRHGVPEKITIDGSAANEAAIKSYNQEHGTAITIRKIKYLNNIVEQDHRVKIPAASGGALEGSCPLCWGNLSPKPPNKDAIPPHRKQWGILA